MTVRQKLYLGVVALATGIMVIGTDGIWMLILEILLIIFGACLMIAEIWRMTGKKRIFFSATVFCLAGILFILGSYTHDMKSVLGILLATLIIMSQLLVSVGWYPEK
jgi:hypothetical protein